MASQIPGLKFSFEVFFRAAGEGSRRGSAEQNTDTGRSPRTRAQRHGAATSAGGAGRRCGAFVPMERKNETVE